ncbi:MAG: PHP domain-containing protein [Candidatus Syntrophosphaera sp.]|nr:PHP domain-containing protein [Candidatus Syntrophosphaera sp.]
MIVQEIDQIKRINLHLHTNVSDGAFSPAQLVERSRQIGLDLISITDHDTADAYRHLPRDYAPLRILPGMEISSTHEESDVHILAYGCDFNNSALIQMMEMYLIGRRDRAIRMIEILAELGLEITLDEVVKVAGSRELIVRPHIAQILVNRGYVRNKNEAFDKYIGNYKPAYVPKPELPVPDALKIIHDAGGLALIAHPGKLVKSSYIEEFIAMGIDGLEVWHPDHYQFEVESFIDICQKNGLYMSAGSDFHGELDTHNLFESVPANGAVLESVNKLWREYLCRRN